eukprot:592435-Pleurochrysis_carterae.AAC.3
MLAKTDAFLEAGTVGIEGPVFHLGARCGHFRSNVQVDIGKTWSIHETLTQLMNATIRSVATAYLKGGLAAMTHEL